MLYDGPGDGPGNPGPDGPQPPPDDGGVHRTSLVEQGAFAYARCTCGWSGPARRARSRARADASAHRPGGAG